MRDVDAGADSGEKSTSDDVRRFAQDFPADARHVAAFLPVPAITLRLTKEIMSEHFDPQLELENLARRLGEYGYRSRRTDRMATSGVMIFSQPIDFGDFQVIEQTVFIHRRGQRWEARVTQHGGPHWVREVDGLDQLAEAALEALRSKIRPPTSEWKIES